jgi:hypothetical protein
MMAKNKSYQYISWTNSASKIESLKMSLELLHTLNGSNTGSFKKWLDAFEGEPRIAWYPSAGTDFRDLMYLSGRYKEHSNATGALPPDIYLHTDYRHSSRSTFLDTKMVYSDEKTTIEVIEFEELPQCILPRDDAVVFFADRNDATDRVLYLKLRVSSTILGDYEVPLLYAFVENAAFCAEKLLPSKSKISHIVHIRYGGGCGGGGYASGGWLLNVLQQLGCELFITDGRHKLQSGDERVCELYPSLSTDDNSYAHSDVLHVLPGASWSDYGNVTWNKIRSR